MIAMLLIAQLTAQAQAAPAVHTLAPRPEVGGVLIADRQKPHPCIANLGRMEVSLAEPTALYRKGDRPAKGLREWASYPTPQLCLIGGAP
jgi:hypothetical protein